MTSPKINKTGFTSHEILNFASSANVSQKFRILVENII